MKRYRVTLTYQDNVDDYSPEQAVARAKEFFYSDAEGMAETYGQWSAAEIPEDVV